MKNYETLKEIIDQLEKPNYQTKDGLHDLKDNAAFIQLKVEGCPSFRKVIEGLKSMSNNYQVLNGQYVISKTVLDIFINHLEF